MQNLLSPPDAGCSASIAAALEAVAGIFPVPAGHRRDLPFAVRDLSRLLTTERGGMTRSYWSAPRFLAAYLHFFLPWNLYRLSWLLPGLPFAFRPDSRILDLGSGPLTLPIALWCARPELRAVPLRFLCCDTASRPMELGRDILRVLAGPDSPWKVELLRAPLDAALCGSPRPSRKNAARHGDPEASHDTRIAAEAPEGFSAIFAGNVLNELSPLRGGTLEERLEGLMRKVRRALAPGALFFGVEPGTRLGGRMIAFARKGGLAEGFQVLLPCTHALPCPMIAQASFYSQSPPVTGWCHFTHPAAQAPSRLQALGQEARLEKDSLALSCLLLQRPLHDGAESEGAGGFSGTLDELEALYEEIRREDGGAVSREMRRHAPTGAAEESVSGRGLLRIISGLIRLPDQPEPGRYACCEKGLALLLDAVRVPSGGAVAVRWAGSEQRDAKTGAVIVTRKQEDSAGRREKAEGRTNPRGRKKAP